MKYTAPYILMLEDDSDDRHITQTFFAEQNYKIGLHFLLHAEDVFPYLEDCIATGAMLPSLILLDKSVPVGGGMRVLEHIKSHPVLQTIPVVMISGTALPDEITESYRLGVNSFISKPFGHEQTQKTIASFVNYWFGTVELPKMAGSQTLA